MTPEQERERGERAKRILDDDLYKESFELVRGNIMRKWAETQVAQVVEREQYFLQLDLLKRLEGTLAYAMISGKVSLFKIEQDKRRKNVGKQ